MESGQFETVLSMALFVRSHATQDGTAYFVLNQVIRMHAVFVGKGGVGVFIYRLS